MGHLSLSAYFSRKKEHTTTSLFYTLSIEGQGKKNSVSKTRSHEILGSNVTLRIGPTNKLMLVLKIKDILFRAIVNFILV